MSSKVVDDDPDAEEARDPTYDDTEEDEADSVSDDEELARPKRQAPMFNKADSSSSSSSSSSDLSARRAKSTPWVEKYRPREIDDIVHQDEVVATLKRAVASGNLPHLLFYGPAGSGKTSAILALANELFGSHRNSKRVLELNASDERGIDVVRNRIKKFAQATVAPGAVGGDASRPLPNFKLVILDEADSMTSAAQTALRRTIEDYSHITRFCLICNYVSRIIDPIASRCAKFRFRPLPRDTIIPRLLDVARAEDVLCSAESAASICAIAGGDLRKAIMYLQCAAMLRRGAIEPEHVVQISGVVPADLVADLVAVLKRGTFENLQSLVDRLLLDGYAATQILSQLFDQLAADATLASPYLARLSLNLANADARLADGADEFTQLLHCCSSIQQLLAKPVSRLSVSQSQ